MKKLFILAITLTFYLLSFSQSPNKFSYQAVIRNASGQLVANSSISVRISILQQSIDGISIYSETHSTLTNKNGLVTILIGEGETTDNFSLIDWSNGPYFIKTETDIEGGDNFDIVGVSQLLSVPYALYANISDSLKGGIKEVDPNFKNSVASKIIANDTIKWNNKLDSINGDESTFKDWDKNASDDFNGDYNSLTNLPNLSDTSIYLKSETDPAFTTSIASKITSNDTTRWNAKSEFGGNYNDLDNLPSWNDSIKANIPDLSNFDNDVTDDFSGSYLDLTNTPNWSDTIDSHVPDLSGFDKDDKNEIQVFSVSLTGDTLYLSSSNFIIIPGISQANHSQVSETTLTDIDGNIYTTIEIEDQIWMAENLKTTKYNDGTSIDLITDYNQWKAAASGAYCWYGNNEQSYKDVYGGLYNWHTVNTNKLCPTGWHVPYKVEWETLVNNLGGWEVAGGKMKESGSAHWVDNVDATNSSNFTGLPGGTRNNVVALEDYINLGSFGYWWTATVIDLNKAHSVALLNFSDDFYFGTSSDKVVGKSIRCIKD